MLVNFIKYSIFSAFIFAATCVNAASFSLSEELFGTFSQTGTGVNYSLTGGDGGSPFVTSSASSCNGVGCTGTGLFLRDEGSGNTLSGTFNFIVNNIFEADSNVYSFGVDYSGDLAITEGTGIYLGATGTGSFNGTDLYFLVLNNSEALFRTAAFAFIDNPDGNTNQFISLNGNTPDVGAVPIPAAAWLFGSGLIGFFGMRRKAIA